MMSDLGDGNIEEFADVIMFLYRRITTLNKLLRQGATESSLNSKGPTSKSSYVTRNTLASSGKPSGGITGRSMDIDVRRTGRIRFALWRHMTNW